MPKMTEIDGTLYLTQDDDDDEVKVDVQLITAGTSAATITGSSASTTGSSATTIGSSASIIRSSASTSTKLPQPSSSGSSKTFKKCSRRKSVGSMEKKLTKKSVKKTVTAAEKLASKTKLAEEKALRRAALEALKVYKPGLCMKYMHIEMHPSLASAWYMADLGAEAAAAGCRLAPATDLCDPALVMWKRTRQQTLDGGNGVMALASPASRCSRALYVAEACAVAEHVAARSLAKHLAHVRDVSECDVTLVVFGAAEYFKKPQRKTANSNRKLMTSIDLEMAITDLLVSSGCDVELVETPSELALLLVHHTRAIAEAPYKLARMEVDDQADFYMRGVKQDSIALDEDGNGVVRLWQQMVSTLPNVSLETARALCCQYKSPLVLHQALLSPSGVNRVAAVGVTRSAQTSARARRLGPELAHRLHKLFTTEDGDCLLD